MRLKIDVYQETILLVVSQDVTARSLVVLAAGLKKHVKPPVRWLYVDFRQSTLSNEMRKSLKQLCTTLTLEGPLASIKLILVGAGPEISPYSTIEEAVLAHPSSESEQFLQRLKLDAELQSLQQKKEAIQENLIPAAAGKLTPAQLNRYLKRAFTAFTAEIKEVLLRTEKKKKLPDSTQSTLESAREKKQKIVDALIKIGLLPKKN